MAKVPKAIPRVKLVSIVVDYCFLVIEHLGDRSFLDQITAAGGPHGLSNDQLSEMICDIRSKLRAAGKPAEPE